MTSIALQQLLCRFHHRRLGELLNFIERRETCKFTACFVFFFSRRSVHLRYPEYQRRLVFQAPRSHAGRAMLGSDHSAVDLLPRRFAKVARI